MRSEIWPFKIWKHLKFRLFEDWISNVWFSKCRSKTLAIAMLLTMWKWDHSKSRHFCLDLNVFWQNGGHLSGFQMVGLLYFRFHLKSKPPHQPLFNHSNLGFQILTVLLTFENLDFNLSSFWMLLLMLDDLT